ncbi:MAG: hypothetical protein WDN67_02935 [Candidatus Moraniibacteriota bacterium]
MAIHFSFEQEISSSLSLIFVMLLSILLAWFTVGAAYRLSEGAQAQLQAEAASHTQLMTEYVEMKHVKRSGLTK